MGVDITGFERRRREEKEREKVAKAKVADEQQNAADGGNEALTIDEVKAALNELGVKFSHNTSEAKLREKLANASK